MDVWPEESVRSKGKNALRGVDMSGCSRSIVLAVLVLAAATQTAGAMAPVEILQAVEDTLNAPADREVHLSMTLIDAEGGTKTRELSILQKDKDKRLIRFLSPADVRGVGFLALEDDLMYIYMPAFAKVRRIASHVKNENFMGTDFTYDDMAQTDYVKNYTPALKEETDSHFVLELVPDEKSEIDYSRLVMWVDKTTMLPDKVEFYDRPGLLLKTMTQTDVRRIDGYLTPHHIEMEDIQEKHKTIMDLKDVVHDQSIPDKQFTQRHLKRF